MINRDSFRKLVLGSGVFLFLVLVVFNNVNSGVLFSPSGDLNPGISKFLLVMFVVSLLIVLVVISFILYYFTHESE